MKTWRAKSRIWLRRTRNWLRKRWLPLMITALGALLLGLVTWMSTAVLAAIGGDTSSARSATVGDSFGGTVGPILSFAALMATIILAAIVQPRREDRAREARLDEKAREDESRSAARDAERAASRAEQVVAWMAETYAEFDGGTTRPVDDGQLGVMVSNTSGSVVFTMDFVTTAKSPGEAGVKRNREALVPPGTWFFPLVGDPDDRDAPLGWRLPVPVDTSGLPTVRFEDTRPQQGALPLHAAAMRTFGVRPHLPTVGKPHYRLDEIRYSLHAQRWSRDESGKVKKQDEPWPAEVEAEFAAAEALIRPSDTTERTIATLISTTMAAISGDPNAYEAKYTLFPAVRDYVPGVVAVSRNRATGLYLHLTNDPAGPLLRVAGNRFGEYPEVVQYYERFVRGKYSAMVVDGLVPEISDKLMALLTDVITASLPGAAFPPQASDWFDGGRLSPRWPEALGRLVALAQQERRARNGDRR
ncbi:hypothetical protein [Microbacterium sp.]|uniref:hypothetical protein n=1 Tax=Microbacterium sp. TaxID=51671 RepID=UPI0039E4E1BC